jgi:predicted dehydrogenase
MTAPLRLGVVGAGRFAHFIADSVGDLPDVTIRAVADPRRDVAAALANAHGARHVSGWTELLDHDDVDVVVVATPPADHAAIALRCLEAGRHVFCEKPLALDPDTAWQVERAVRQTGRVLVVDHVLRYNPILSALRRLDGTLLGPLQRFCLENDASDEDLDDQHWFWDQQRSGGIFVEHGVHFFDAAAMLFGHPATSVQAVAARRPGGTVDMVSANALHGPERLATHTHSFTHAHRCERQLMRLDYGSAEVRVEGWIPVRCAIDLWTDDAGVAHAQSLPGREAELMHVEGFRLGDRAHIHVVVERDAADRPDARGRGRALHIPHHVHLELSLGGATAKAAVYAESVRAAMVDLVASVRRQTAPRSGARAAAEAVSVAVAATRSAAAGHLVAPTGGAP